MRSVQDDRVRLGDFIDALGHRAFGLAILIFALANIVISHVPGISTILSFPIILISLQMVAGAHRPWLPKAIADRELKRETLEKIVARSCAVLHKVEVFIKPRLLFLVMRTDRMLGVACLIFSIVLALPILFGNWLPAWALALVALGMIERDGLLILGGIAVGIGGVAYAFTFFHVALQALHWALQ